MKKRRGGNKSGQFYLLSAIIIIGILISFVAVVNYLSKSLSSKVDEFSQELKIEGEKVLDYDKINGESEFENFAKNYSNYAGEEIEIYYVVGEIGGMEVYYFDDSDLRVNQDFDEEGNSLNVTLNNVVYDFNLKKGVNFNFIIVEEKGGERYVVKG